MGIKPSKNCISFDEVLKKSKITREKWYMKYFYYPFHWYFVNPINNSYWAIRYFIQRIFIGFDDREVFNLDYCLKEWLAPRLEKLIKTRGCGIPGFSKLTEKKWANILNEILWLARDTYKEEQNLILGKVKNKDKKWKEFNKREENARKLFGKYLNYLCD